MTGIACPADEAHRPGRDRIEPLRAGHIRADRM